MNLNPLGFGLVQRGLNSVPIKHWSLDAYRYPKRRSLPQEAIATPRGGEMGQAFSKPRCFDRVDQLVKPAPFSRYPKRRSLFQEAIATPRGGEMGQAFSKPRCFDRVDQLVKPAPFSRYSKRRRNGAGFF
ncbi:MAG: hypothetical protein AB4426_21415 [Xenococcaceae cyanobacterium]